MEEFRAGEQPKQILGTDLVATFSWRAEEERLCGRAGENDSLCPPTAPLLALPTPAKTPQKPKTLQDTASRASLCMLLTYDDHLCLSPCWSQGSDRARAELIRSTD